MGAWCPLSEVLEGSFLSGSMSVKAMKGVTLQAGLFQQKERCRNKEAR